jgi:hypothetical protein
VSAGLVLIHKDLGTTPNMAPPSNLKLPALTGYNLISKRIRMQITKRKKH